MNPLNLPNDLLPAVAGALLSLLLLALVVGAGVVAFELVTYARRLRDWRLRTERGERRV